MKKPAKAPETAVNQRFALLQNRERQAARSALVALARPPPVLQPQPQPQPDPEAHNENRFDALIMADGDDPAYSSNKEVVNPPANRRDYYCSITYQEQNLREEANWRVVLQKVFHNFMTCCHQTYQWCDQNLWNQDLNPDCKCKDWQKQTVVIDTIDFESQKTLSVKLCDCTSDLVQLVRLGYMGSSPSSPQTAFSIRLLRFLHILWKHSGIRLQYFTETMDKYLDPQNSLFVVLGTDETRDLRCCFPAAVDAYREMLRMEDELASLALWLTPLDVLAGNCPPCFGPKVTGKRADKPDHIFCLDPNLQQQRHLSASAAWRGDTGVLPLLFLSPANVLSWKTKMEPVNQKTNPEQPVDDVVMRTCRACDETGLMGMACCHDNLLKFINIVQSGERGYYPLAMLDWILQILYDIGCNLEKSIIKVNHQA
ncbi:hypothetical protein DFH28DRAFT_1080789 [Melampsora americana]|nr:hypothetical protein DFH28DRAFT_1080789 [Melampsora americana]